MALMRRLAWIVYGAFLVFGLVVSPRVLGDLLERGEVPSARRTRARVGERLEALEGRFRELSDQAEELDFRVAKIRVVYGLERTSPPEEEPEVEADAFADSVYREHILEAVRLATDVRLAIGELETEVSGLRDFEAAHPDVVAVTPSIFPVAGESVLTSGMGPRKSPYTGLDEYHAGVDLSAVVGTPILAPADGQVAFVGFFRTRRRSSWWRFGRMVAIRHGKEFLTLYGNCSKILVSRGARVHRGDVIAEVGESGVTANPRLHYSVWRRNEKGVFEPVDPRLYMLDRVWDDEEDLLAHAGERPEVWQYENLPRGLR